MSCDSDKGQVKKERANRIFPYDRSIELKMILVYTLYSEKDRRLYAAAEALKLGYGGISYISRVLGCDRKTILRGLLELNCPESIEKDGIRTKGGGRKTSLESISGLDANFLEVIFFYTAGDPMDERVRWTHLTHQQIADKLKEKGIDVSRKIVKKLFKK
ncbi:Rhodopirellula transposase DDE domain-containing protein, partial [Candidatus Methanophagaceae archaeon]